MEAPRTIASIAQRQENTIVNQILAQEGFCVFHI